MEHRKRHQTKEKDTQETFIERRYLTSGLEIRGADTGVSTLRGYALRFGVSYDMGWFDEEVSEQAFDAANISDVRILFNHDSNLILGRTVAGTARVGIDKEGMWYEVDLPSSPNGENMREAVERGDVTQSSWGFSLKRDDAGKTIGDKWEVRNGRKYRVITAVDTVYDASPVVYPANPDTTIAKRAFSQSGIELKAEDAGSDTLTDGAEAAGTWTVAWMLENLSWATVSSSSMVSSINDCIEDYGYWAKQELKESAVFESLLNTCKSAKAALIELLDAHIEALRVLNHAENRSDADKAGDHSAVGENFDKDFDVHNKRLEILGKRFLDK